MQDYLEYMEEFYSRHQDFDEFCNYYSLDSDAIVERLKDVFFDGIRRSGSWERQAVQMIFGDIEMIFEEYEYIEIDTSKYKNDKCHREQEGIDND